MQSKQQLIDKVRADLNAGKGYKRRRFVDSITAWIIKSGGIGVVFAVVLIFFYLISVVLPLFYGAELVRDSEITLQQSTTAHSLDISSSKYLGTEEYAEVITNISTTGLIQFFDNKGNWISDSQVPINKNQRVTTVEKVSGKPNWLAIIVSNREVYLVSQEYKLTYPEGKRIVIPAILFPFGEEPLNLGNDEINKLSFFANDAMLMVSFSDQNQKIKVQRYLLEENFITESISLEKDAEFESLSRSKIAGLMFANDGRWLYVASKDGEVSLHTFEADELIEIDRGKIESKSTIDQFLA
jgi:phosphate transport system permease protein